MKLGHVAMYVRDLQATKAFYEKYFGASANEKYRNNVSGLETYFLTFDDGARLEIMSRPDCIDSAKHQLATGLIHIAFNVGSKEAVDSLTETLKADGFEVISGPRTTGDGYYESCVRDCENNLVEITV